MGGKEQEKIYREFLC